jgi:plasmid stability protein
MATVQIRNLDDDAYAVLRTRAAASGRSLQEYLRLLLEEQARRDSLADTFSRLRLEPSWSSSSVTVEDIVELQRDMRAR